MGVVKRSTSLQYLGGLVKHVLVCKRFPARIILLLSVVIFEICEGVSLNICSFISLGFFAFVYDIVEVRMVFVISGAPIFASLV